MNKNIFHSVNFWNLGILLETQKNNLKKRSHGCPAPIIEKKEKSIIRWHISRTDFFFINIRWHISRTNFFFINKTG